METYLVEKLFDIGRLTAGWAFVFEKKKKNIYFENFFYGLNTWSGGSFMQ